MTSVNNIRFIEPTTKARALFVATLVIAVIALALADWIADFPMPAEGTPPQEFDRQLHNLVLATWLLLGMGVVFSAAWSAHFAHMGLKGISSREFPPVGTLVVFRTKIKTGPFAIVSSWFAIGIAVVFWAPVVILSYGLYFVETIT